MAKTRNTRDLKAELAKVKAQIVDNEARLEAAQAALAEVDRKLKYLREIERLLQERRSYGAAKQRQKELN